MAETRALPPFKAPRIGNLCAVKWESMTGSATIRSCDLCSLHVHNLSAMPREEVHTLLAESKGRLCLAYYADAEGNLLTMSEVGAAREETAQKAPAAASASTALALAAASRCEQPQSPRWSLSALLAGIAASFASFLTGCVSVPPLPTVEPVTYAMPPVMKEATLSPTEVAWRKPALSADERWPFASPPHGGFGPSQPEPGTTFVPNVMSVGVSVREP